MIDFKLLIQKYADQLGLTFLETSAKDSINVDQTFLTLATEITLKPFHENSESVHNETDSSSAPAGFTGHASNLLVHLRSTLSKPKKPSCC